MQVLEIEAVRISKIREDDLFEVVGLYFVKVFVSRNEKLKSLGRLREMAHIEARTYISTRKIVLGLIKKGVL